MTLVVAFNGLPFSVMASDRLVTLADPKTGRNLGDHDALANKVIVFISFDAVVTLGYSGSAYLSGDPTDEWIVKTLTPGGEIFTGGQTPPLMGGRVPSRLRFHQLCNRLRRGLSNVHGGSRVTIVIAGWRLRRRKLLPISLTLSASASLGPDIDMRMRPTWPLQPRLRWTGAMIRGAEVQRALVVHHIETRPVDEQTAVAFLTDLIRAQSSADPTVGANVMSVTIPWPTSRKITCLFDPATPHYGEMEVSGVHARLLTAFSPWIITPTFFRAPSESTGDLDTSAQLEVDGWTIEFASVSRAPPTPSTVFWETSQDRMPPPGLSRRPRRR